MSLRQLGLEAAVQALKIVTDGPPRRERIEAAEATAERGERRSSRRAESREGAPPPGKFEAERTPSGRAAAGFPRAAAWPGLVSELIRSCLGVVPSLSRSCDVKSCCV